jgi:hypothetical protein
VSGQLHPHKNNPWYILKTRQVEIKRALEAVVVKREISFLLQVTTDTQIAA